MSALGRTRRPRSRRDRRPLHGELDPSAAEPYADVGQMARARRVFSVLPKRHNSLFRTRVGDGE